MGAGVSSTGPKGVFSRLSALGFSHPQARSCYLSLLLQLGSLSFLDVESLFMSGNKPSNPPGNHQHLE